jgi:zinc protease
LPEFRVFHPSDHLQLWVAEHGVVPEVSLRLLLDAGAAAEDANQAGVAELTARLLTEGAGDRDAVGMAEWLDRLGAAFRASVQYDIATMAMHCLSDVTEGALDFLATVLREPRFQEHEVDRVRGERLDEIERQFDEPAIVADHALIDAVYGKGLYARPAGGKADTVSSLQAADVRAYHAARYSSAGAVLILCGAVDGDRAADLVSARLGDWPAVGPASPVPECPAGPAVEGGVIVIDRPGSPQAEIRIGTVGAAHGTQDLFSIIVANAILGGLFNSRINMNLREDKGWTYGAFQEMLAEIRGMTERPPDPDEMRLAKNALTLSLPLQFETAGQVAGKVARQLIYRLPADYWETYRDNVEAVTSGDVVRVCERYLTEDRLVLLAVTDAEATAGTLDALGPVTVRTVPEA